MTEETSTNEVQVHEESTVTVPEPPSEPSETSVKVAEPSVAETVVEPLKPKRKRSEAQVNALVNARKNKASKHKTLKKPVKIERGKFENSEEIVFSWPKEVAKVSLLAGLGLVSVFVQQKFAQNQMTPASVVATEVNLR